VLLANPGVALATPEVFAARRGAFSAPARFRAMPSGASGLAVLLAERRNDLSDAAVVLLPVIADVLARLALLPGALLTRMSGSGATCFALFATLEEAEAAAQHVRAERPNWWIAPAKLL